MPNLEEAQYKFPMVTAIQCIPEFHGKSEELPPFLMQVDYFADNIPEGESHKLLLNVVYTKLKGDALFRLPEITGKTWVEVQENLKKIFQSVKSIGSLINEIEILKQGQNESFECYKSRGIKLYHQIRLVPEHENDSYADAALRLHFLGGLRNITLSLAGKSQRDRSFLDLLDWLQIEVEEEEELRDIHRRLRNNPNYSNRDQENRNNSFHGYNNNFRNNNNPGNYYQHGGNFNINFNKNYQENQNFGNSGQNNNCMNYGGYNHRENEDFDQKNLILNYRDVSKRDCASSYSINRQNCRNIRYDNEERRQGNSSHSYSRITVPVINKITHVKETIMFNNDDQYIIKLATVNKPDKLFTYLLDTGANNNVIQWNVIHVMGITDLVNYEDVITIAGVGGKKIKTIGSIWLHVIIGELSFPVKFYVMQKLCVQGIIGAKFIRDHMVYLNNIENYAIFTKEQLKSKGCNITLMEEIANTREQENKARINMQYQNREHHDVFQNSDKVNHQEYIEYDGDIPNENFNDETDTIENHNGENDNEQQKLDSNEWKNEFKPENEQINRNNIIICTAEIHEEPKSRENNFNETNDELKEEFKSIYELKDNNIPNITRSATADEPCKDIPIEIDPDTVKNLTNEQMNIMEKINEWEFRRKLNSELLKIHKDIIFGQMNRLEKINAWKYRRKLNSELEIIHEMDEGTLIQNNEQAKLNAKDGLDLDSKSVYNLIEHRQHKTIWGNDRTYKLGETIDLAHSTNDNLKKK